jgi:hypothetical protein
MTEILPHKPSCIVKKMNTPKPSFMQLQVENRTFFNYNNINYNRILINTFPPHSARPSLPDIAISDSSTSGDLLYEYLPDQELPPRELYLEEKRSFNPLK